MLHIVSQFEYSKQLSKLLAVRCELQNIPFMLLICITHWILLQFRASGGAEGLVGEHAIM